MNCCLLLFYTTTNHFSIRLWHAMKSRVYMTTSSVARPRKKLQSSSKSQTCIKNSHGHCLVVCCLSDPLQLSESHWNRYIWEEYSANWWEAPKTAMPAASISQENGPSSSAQSWTTHRRSWTHWAMKFCLIHHSQLTSCQPASPSLSSFTTFCRENASTASLRQKILAKSWLNTKAQIFMLQEQSNLFLIGKNVLIVTFLFWLLTMCVSLVMI